MIATVSIRDHAAELARSAKHAAKSKEAGKVQKIKSLQAFENPPKTPTETQRHGSSTSEEWIRAVPENSWNFENGARNAPPNVTSKASIHRAVSLPWRCDQPV